jgi:hypothetical protein
MLCPPSIHPRTSRAQFPYFVPSITINTKNRDLSNIMEITQPDDWISPFSVPRSRKLFTHQPLVLSQPQIRLLKIVPSHNDSNIIEQEMCHFNQSDQPYRALSYTWGSAMLQRDILINSKHFSVRQNLWSFLQTQRADDEGYSGWYWIDALCIDQSDTLERNHQVQLMTQIYERVSEVRVWLGEANSDSDIVMKYCFTICGMTPQEGTILRRSPPLLFIQPGKEEIEFYRTMRRFDQRPYWKRIWILQEFILANDLVIQCGRFKISWNTFWKVWSRLLCLSPERVPHIRDLGHLRTDHQQGNISRGRASLSGWNWILVLEKSKCTDVRDKIYGLHALTQEKYRVEVDYSKTVLNIYFEVLRLVPRVADTSWSIEKTLNFSEDLRLYLKLEEIERKLLKRIYKGEIFVTNELKKMTSRASQKIREKKDWKSKNYLVRLSTGKLCLLSTWTNCS